MEDNIGESGFPRIVLRFESLFEGLWPLTFTFTETGQITTAIHIQLNEQVARAKYTYTTITRFGVSLMTKVLGAEKPFLI